jgi:hypothetical protein
MGQKEAFMTWTIARADAIADPLAARMKVMEKLRGLSKLDDPEEVVLPILVDAILMSESYRGSRHQITFLNELTRKVDELVRQLTIAEKVNEWSSPI